MPRSTAWNLRDSRIPRFNYRYDTFRIYSVCIIPQGQYYTTGDICKYFFNVDTDVRIISYIISHYQSVQTISITLTHDPY